MSLEERGQYEALYRDLPDAALLQVAIDSGLKTEAKAALREEMSRRSLTGNDVKELHAWQKKQNARTQARMRETLFMGMGFRLVGRKFLSERDREEGVYVSTEFFVMKHGTVFPIGSYRVKKSDHGLPKKIERIKLQRDQVWQELKWDLLFYVIVAVIFYLAKARHR